MFISALPAARKKPKPALKFKAVAYSDFAFREIIVRANGVETAPDADGYYSLPQTADTAIVTAEGTARDDAAPNGRVSFRELLISFFRKTVAFFTGVFENNTICGFTAIEQQ